MKNFKKTTLALVVTLATGYGVYTSQQKPELSELALANIEALANGENSSSITAHCDPVSIVVTSKCFVICPSCYTEWRPFGSPTGKTDVSSISGCCSCGYCF